MHITDEQKKLLKLLYLTYGRTIPYHFGGMGKLEEVVYTLRPTVWDGWWVMTFGSPMIDNEYLTYTSEDDWASPVTVTDKFIELVMEEL